MADFLLKISGSNQIVNIIDIDVSSSFESPTGYVTQSATTESRITNEVSSSQLQYDNYYVGDFNGNVYADNLLIDGNDFYNIISSDKFGYFYYTQSTDLTTNVNPGNGYFKLNYNQNTVWGTLSGSIQPYSAPSKIAISLQQKTPDGIIYSSYAAEEKFKHTIMEINEKDIQGSFLLLKDRNNTIVKKLEILSSSIQTQNSNSYAVLDVYERYKFFDENYYTSIDSISTTSSSLDSGSINLTGSILVPNGTIFDVEIIKGVDKTLSGSFTGSFSGSFSGLSPFSTIEIYETSSNWTKPSWAKNVKVVLIGGGGGGGSAYGISNASNIPGAGGGAGGTLTVVEFDASTLPTSSISVFVGGGGFKGQNGADGGNGGGSQFGDYAHAPGGQGGQGYLTPRVKPSQTNLLLGGIANAYKIYSSTGGGPGGAGSILSEEYIPFLPFNDFQLFKCAIAPSLPYDDDYLRANPMYLVPGQTNGWNGSLNIPASIAPTGGGGGLGYETAASGSGAQDGETSGGSIIIGTLDINNREWNNRFGDKFYPAYNTKIGLGGSGGIPSGSIQPTQGSIYGGGGGGAYAGAPQYSSDPFETIYNDGASGASGVVVIISEA